MSLLRKGMTFLAFRKTEQRYSIFDEWDAKCKPLMKTEVTGEPADLYRKDTYVSFVTEGERERKAMEMKKVKNKIHRALRKRIFTVW